MVRALTGGDCGTRLHCAYKVRFRASHPPFSGLLGFGELIPRCSGHTVAVLPMVVGNEYPTGTWYVEVIVRVPPGARVPSAQGYAVVQAPLFETKARPDGVGSATDTSTASELPLLATVTV